jgi:hypothetical protein
MKHLFTFGATVAMMAAVSAQDLSPRPLNPSQLGRPVGVLAKTVDYQKTTNVYDGYIDYEEYDRALFAAYQRFVDFQNVNFVDTGSLWRSYVGFPELILTQDYQAFTPVSWNAVTQVQVDTVFFGFAHWNNSGTNDTINVLLMDMGADNRPIDANVFWQDQIVSDTTLAGVPTSTGFPIRFQSIPVGVNAPAQKFAMALEYRGAVADTFAVLFGYPSNGNQCGSLTNGGSPLPAPQPTAVGTHYAYFRINLGTANSILIPTTAGAGYWYFDCNGNNTPDWPDENPYQNFSFWSYVTVTEVLDLGTLANSEVKIYPNPTGEQANLKIDLNGNASVSYEIRDLSGRTVAAQNFGSVAAGQFDEIIDVRSFAKGVYILSLTVGAETVTHKIVVQ